MNYFICGFSGAGKSTVLKKLEEESSTYLSQYTIIDLDDYILQNFGPEYGSLGVLIEKLGLEMFRNLEFRSLLALSAKSDLIVALGGGALNEQTLKTLSSSKWKGLWLATDFETCFSRIEGDSNRPLVKLGKEALEKLYLERKPLYARFTQVIDHSQVVKIIESYKG